MPDSDFKVAGRTPAEDRNELSAMREFQNKSRDLNQLGLGANLESELRAEKPSSFETATDPIFDAIQVGLFGVTGFADELMDTGSVSKAFHQAAVELNGAIGIGDRGEANYLGTPRQLNFGEIINERVGIDEGDDLRYVSAALGFVLDIAFDPLTYTGFGLAKSLRILRGIDDIPLAGTKFEAGAAGERALKSSRMGVGFRRKFMSRSLLKGLAEGENAAEMARVMTEVVQTQNPNAAAITAEEISGKTADFLQNEIMKNVSIEQQSAAFREEILSLTADMGEGERHLMGGFLLEHFDTNTGKITGIGAQAIDGLNINNNGKKFLHKRLGEWAGLYRRMADAEVEVNLLSPTAIRGRYAFGVKPVTGLTANVAKKIAEVRFGKRANGYLKETDPGYRLISDTSMLSGAHAKSYPSEIARVLDAVATETDIAMMGSRRGLESIRKISTKKLFDTVLDDNRFALKIDNAVAKNVNDPLHQQMKEMGLDFFTPPAFKAGEETASITYALPKVLVEHLNDAQKIMSGDENMNKFLKGYKDVLGIWKAYALMSPGYHMRNTYSNLFNNWLGKVSNPARYYEGIVLQVEDTANLPGPVRATVENLMGGRKTIDDLTFKLKDGTTVTGRQFKEEAKQNGILGTGQLNTESNIGMQQDMLNTSSMFKKSGRVPATVLEGGLKGWGDRGERVEALANKMVEVSRAGEGTLKEDEAFNVAELYDVVARTWAWHNDLTPDDWYKSFIHDFQPGMPAGFEIGDMNPNIFTQEAAVAPAFYSKLNNVLTGVGDGPRGSFLGDRKGPTKASEVLKFVRSQKGKGKFKDAEVDFTGIEEFLEGQGGGLVDKNVVNAWFNWNHVGSPDGTGGIRIESVDARTPGAIDFSPKAFDEVKEAARGLKIGESTDIDTGPNALDIAIERLGPEEYTVRTGDEISTVPSLTDAFLKIASVGGIRSMNHPYITMKGGFNHEERLLKWGVKDADMLPVEDRYWFGQTPDAEQHFRNRHDVPDVFASYRTAEFTNEEGGRVLVIQEIQSDWSQTIRKAFKFSGENGRIEWNTGLKKGMRPTRQIGSQIRKTSTGTVDYNAIASDIIKDGGAVIEESSSGFSLSLLATPKGKKKVHTYTAQSSPEKARQHFADTIAREHEVEMVPQQPFAQKDVWHTIATKQIIKDAAARGYDEVAWLDDADSLFEVEGWTGHIDKMLKPTKENSEFLFELGIKHRSIDDIPVPKNKTEPLSDLGPQGMDEEFDESLFDPSIFTEEASVAPRPVKEAPHIAERPLREASSLTFEERALIFDKMHKQGSGYAGPGNAIRSIQRMNKKAAADMNILGAKRGWNPVIQKTVSARKTGHKSVDQFDFAKLDEGDRSGLSDATYAEYQRVRADIGLKGIDPMFDEDFAHELMTGIKSNKKAGMTANEFRAELTEFMRNPPSINRPVNVYSLALKGGTRSDIMENAMPLMQKKGGAAHGAAAFREDGSAVIHAAKGNDGSLFIHELAHIVRRGMIAEGDTKTINRWVDEDLFNKSIKDDEPFVWKKKHEERFAKAIEQYAMDGIPPHGASRAMEGTFERLSEMMQDIYPGVEGQVGATISPEVQEVMRRIMGRGIDEDPDQLLTAKALLEGGNSRTFSDEPIYDKLKRNLGNNWATRLNQTVGRHMEDNSRLAHFIQKRINGDDAGRAAQSVKRFLFDYTELTPFERDTMKMFIPFYTWARKNIPLQIEQIINQPERYARIPKLMNEVSGISGDAENIPQPDYFQEVNATRLPWNSNDQPQFLAQDLPFQDLNRLNTKDMLSNMTPFLKVWAELLPPGGANFFTERPIEGFSGEPNIVDIFGANEELPWGKKMQHAIESLVPPAGKAFRAARKIAAGKGGEQALRELAGLSVVGVDVDAVVRGNRYMKREVARRVSRKLKKRIAAFGFEEGLRRSQED